VSARQAGLLLVVVGAAATLLAVLANPLGIGDPGFHWKQGVLLAVGVVLALVGLAVALRAPQSDE
jgi:hypothetical protein